MIGHKLHVLGLVCYNAILIGQTNRCATPSQQASGREKPLPGTEGKSHDSPAPAGNRQKTKEIRLVIGTANGLQKVLSIFYQ